MSAYTQTTLEQIGLFTLNVPLNNHKLRFVRMKPLLKRDIVDWSEAKILSFIQFADFFVDKTKDPHTFTCVDIGIKAALSRAEDDEHWAEFMARIYQEDKTTTKEFKYRIMAMVRVVMAWLKTNPYAITDQMKAIMENNQRLAWGLNSFKTVTTDIGAEVTEMDNTDVTDPSRTNADPHLTTIQSPEVMLGQAMTNMASILNRLTRGISNKEISSLDAKEKIKLAASLAPVLTKAMTNHKPNIKMFKQIVINKAGKDDLEKAFLDYTESQSDDE